MEEIIVFGRGNILTKSFEEMKKKYHILCFLDNSVQDKEFDTTYKTYVYNPANLKDLPSNVRIICISLYFVDMWKQLISLGVDPQRIAFEKSIYVNEKTGGLFSETDKLIAKSDKIIFKTQEYGEFEIYNKDDYLQICKKVFWFKNKECRGILNLPKVPASRKAGTEHGKAVDRYYIDKFIGANREYIKGHVMEIASPLYINRFGTCNITEKIILHVKGWGCNAVKGNFETGEGIEADWVDCLIFTQTLQYIFDLESAIRNIYKCLKPNGVVMLTVPGIKPLSIYDDENWGEKWSFTKKTLERLLLMCFDKDKIEVTSNGNVKTATAFLYGLAVEDLKEEDFAYNDPQYPFIITALAKK